MSSFCPGTWGWRITDPISFSTEGKGNEIPVPGPLTFILSPFQHQQKEREKEVKVVGERRTGGPLPRGSPRPDDGRSSSPHQPHQGKSLAVGDYMSKRSKILEKITIT